MRDWVRGYMPQGRCSPVGDHQGRPQRIAHRHGRALPGWPSNIIPKGSGEFERESVRIGTPKAIVAIARKLLVAVWHVLSRRCADIHADVQAVARSLLRWTARCGTTPGKRRSQALLLRHYLDQLGRGRRSGRNSLQWSPLSPQRCAPGRRKDLRALLLSFLSGLPESSTLLLPVKTRALRGYAGLDTPQHALFAVVRSDLKLTNRMVFCPLDLLSTSVSTSVSEKIFS
jgi:hypothetical protein